MRKFGNFLMILGALLILGALGLFFYNQYEQTAAEQAAAELMPKLQAAISQNTPTEDPSEEPPLMETLPASAEMTEVEIDGYGYIGYLSIPALDLELPVMSELDYKRLRVAPCRFTGTVMDDDLVIAAHNYARHFGGFRNLTPGDRVIFTDMEGRTTVYAVVAVDILAPTAVEEVTNSGFDLALFTCTYGGESRITVFCDRADP